MLTRGMVIASVHEGKDVDTCEFAESRLRMLTQANCQGAFIHLHLQDVISRAREHFSGSFFWRWESSVGTITVENRRGC